MNEQGSSPTSATLAPPRKYFSVEEANRALPYVARIAQDVHDAYQLALQLHEQIERDPDAEHKLHSRYEDAVKDLNRYVDELQQVGAELKDFNQGLVDFPALYEGREICLCWKSGEKSITAWHETDAGFSGRQDIALLDEDA